MFPLLLPGVVGTLACGVRHAVKKWRVPAACFMAALLLSAAPALLAQQSPFLSIPPAADTAALRFGAPFPEFEARDITGRIWRADDLRGRVTVIYIWNTFLARGLDKLSRPRLQNLWGLPHLPELQRFHDDVRSANRIQVLTFCTDYDYMHAHDYMREKNYTFPVIADWVLIRKLFPAGGEQWIVNPEGRISDPLPWSFGRLLYETERAAGRR